MRPSAVAEKAAVLVILFLYTGGVVVVIFQGDGALTANVQTILRLIWPPIYLVTILLILPRIVRVAAITLQTPLLLALLAIPIVSVLWSVAPDETLRRSVALVATTAFGIYLAERFDSYELLRILMWMFLVTIVLSFIFVFALPQMGIMHRQPHIGAWRGVFVHKNVLGRYMVVALLVFVLLATWTDRPMRWLWLIVPLAGLLLFMSNSKTPLVAGAVTLLVFPLVSLLRLKPLASLAGLAIASAMVVLLGALVWLNFELLLGGVGRDASLTGRTDLWDLVISKIKLQPWFGYGYVAFWADPNGPASDVWAILRWKAPNAHSGLLELMLGIGVLGMLTFALAYIVTFVKALQRTRGEFSGEAIWIQLYLCLYLVVSVTESSILERNSLFWILFVYCMCRVSTFARRPVFEGLARQPSSDQHANRALAS